LFSAFITQILTKVDLGNHREFAYHSGTFIASYCDLYYGSWGGHDEHYGSDDFDVRSMRKINQERLKTKYSNVTLIGNYLFTESGTHRIWKKTPGKGPESIRAKVAELATGRIWPNELHCDPYQFQIVCTEHYYNKDVGLKVFDLKKDVLVYTVAERDCWVLSFYGECIQDVIYISFTLTSPLRLLISLLIDKYILTLKILW
jgi:hypothetical protein